MSAVAVLRVPVHRRVVPVDGRGRPESAGRRLLLVLLQTRTRADVAHAVGVTPGEISHLASGARAVPSLRLAVALEQECGINHAAWLT